MARRAPVVPLQEAADALGVHYMTAYRYLRTGRMAAERRDGRWYVSQTEIDRLQGPAGPDASPGVARPRRLAARLLAGDEPGAWQLVETALAGGAEPEEVTLGLIAPALRIIGEGWQRGRTSIAEEHRATAVATRVVSRLGPRFTRQGRRRATVVAGCPPSERHALPAAILVNHLHHAGYDVVDLGVGTPAEAFSDALRSHPATRVLLVGVTTAGLDQELADVLTAAGRQAPGVVRLAGGAAVSGAAHARRLGADGWSGRTAADAVTRLARLGADGWSGRSAAGAVTRMAGLGPGGRPGPEPGGRSPGLQRVAPGPGPGAAGGPVGEETGT